MEHIAPGLGRVTVDHDGWPDQVGIRAGAVAAKLAAACGVAAVAFPKPHIAGAALDPVLAAGCFGLVLTESQPLLKADPSDPLSVGNNPIAVAAPTRPAFLFDGALSHYSFSPLVQRARDGEGVPEDAVVRVSEESSPEDVILALRRGDSSQGGLAPIGGVKGFGLALGVEMLVGALTGGFLPPAPGKPWGQGALVVAFRPFPSHALEAADAYLHALARFPGQRSYEAMQAARTLGGIEYPAPTLQALDELESRVVV